MAVYTYSTTNIDFSTFDVWSNTGFTDDTDITLSTVLSDAYPAATNPSSVSEIYNRSWFYGNVVSTGNGTVQITYPYNFSEWRTASGGGGGQISTSANLDLTVSDYTSQVNFYAYFV